MCAILDNDVGGMVFGSNPTQAATKFREWVQGKNISLVVGGRLKTELSRNRKIKEWLSVGEQSGFVKLINDDEVNEETTYLKDNSLCQSNDEHVIALAQVSGARLLYTRDEDLKDDFLDGGLISAPGGKVYPERIKKHRDWLGNNKNLCKRGP